MRVCIFLFCHGVEKLRWIIIGTVTGAIDNNKEIIAFCIRDNDEEAVSV